MIEYHRDILAWLGQVGAEDARIIQGAGKHPRVVFSWRGEERWSSISLTPSDRRSAANQISALRHQLGLVGEVKRVGARRAHHRPGRSSVVALPTLSAGALSDWRDGLAQHPAAVASLRARADAAWLAWWRELLRSVGGRSLI